MPFVLSDLTHLADLPFDEVIDVRSPSEYAEDHIPGAVSLPVLSDAERAEVGTVYVQDDRFRARKIGAAIVARNAAHHLETFLSDKPGGYCPLVYCWRGGQRSGSFASILKQVGWRADTLDGGYRSYRRLVARLLHDDPFPCGVLLLDGDTGTAKTEILNRLPKEGLQVLDLEGLARHRGSALGAVMQPQPSQKAFESALATMIARLDPTKAVVIEAESARVGVRSVPPSLWQAMLRAPRVVLRSPLSERARHLARAYADVTSDPQELTARLRPLHRLHGWDTIQRWQALIDARAWEELASDLMRTHYDPRYRKQRRAPAATELTVQDLSTDALPEVARNVADALRSLTPA